MGRRDRERIARINRGEELPLSARTGVSTSMVLDTGTVIRRGKMLFCHHCKTTIPEYRARAHIRECWGLDLGPNDPIPTTPKGRKINMGDLT